MLASIGGIESPQSHQQNPFRLISLATSKGIPYPLRHHPLHRRRHVEDTLVGHHPMVQVITEMEALLEVDPLYII